MSASKGSFSSRILVLSSKRKAETRNSSFEPENLELPPTHLRLPPRATYMADHIPEPKMPLREEKCPKAAFKCGLCPAQYSSKEQLEEHQATAHGVEKEKEKQ